MSHITITMPDHFVRKFGLSAAKNKSQRILELCDMGFEKEQILKRDAVLSESNPS